MPGSVLDMASALGQLPSGEGHRPRPSQSGQIPRVVSTNLEGSQEALGVSRGTLTWAEAYRTQKNFLGVIEERKMVHRHMGPA